MSQKAKIYQVEQMATDQNMNYKQRAENAIRPLAVGRKGYLFCGTMMPQKMQQLCAHYWDAAKPVM